MGRSLYGMLHRRHGRRPTGAERARHARMFRERAREALPLEVFGGRVSTGGASPNVAVVGAGFAGCAAAHVLNASGAQVTVYDAAGSAGGRVSSSTTIVPGRILEAGAELIGLNHPAWLIAAEALGFGMSVVTPDDDYAGQGLAEPLIFAGEPWDSEALYNAMTSVFELWTAMARSLVSNPYAPWTSPFAAGLDSFSLAQMIPGDVSEAVIAAIALEFEMNNTTPVGNQSWLANLAQFAAGQADMLGTGSVNFFDYTEVFRCAAGNQALASALLGSTPVTGGTLSAVDTGATGVTLTFADGTSAGFDYVVVATSVDAWSNLTLDGAPFTNVFAPVNFGPAVKYLAPVSSRFWLQHALAPSSMVQGLGMTWEGTDNQMDTAGYDLTVFAGGTAATDAINAGGSDSYFAPLISNVYPGFSTPGGIFANEGSTVLMGYSCPAPGEVTGAQQSYATPYQGLVAVAGEHTSPAWFGFMEGALESGLVAGDQILAAAQ